MKRIVVLFLMLGLAACGKLPEDQASGDVEKDDKGKGRQPVVAPIVAPAEPIASVPAPVVAPVPAPVVAPANIPEEIISACVPPSVNDSSRESYLPRQVYSANDFKTHYPLKWCTGGLCDQAQMPKACNSMVVFSDFSFYSPISATFFDSITESVSVNTITQEVTLTSDTTGHKGMVFKYKYLKEAQEWLVIYGTNCSRLYQHALGL